MDMHAIRRKNLRDLISSEEGGSVAAFARKSGFTEGRLSQLLSRTFRQGQNFGEKMARKIEQQCNLPTLYLDEIPEDLSSIEAEAGGRTLNGSFKSPMGADDRRRILSYLPSIAEISIVRWTVDESGVNYKPILEQDGDRNAKIGVRMAWLREANILIQQILATKIIDDAMAPSLYPGDLLVVDLKNTELEDGAVFVIGYEGVAIVRRIVRDAGTWWIVCDNPDQRRFGRKLFPADFAKVIGRVVLKESKHI